MLSFKDFKSQAFALYGDTVLPADKDPISALYSIGWNIPNGPAFPEDEMAHMNVRLDDKGCFGRAVKAAVLVEKYFPKETFFIGEVREDLLHTILMNGATSEKWADDTYIAEVIQYENPHVVLVWNDQQFDPLFAQLSEEPQLLRHPSVVRYNLWEGLYCSYLVSVALSHQHTPQIYLQFLQQAESLCPNMLLPKENQIHALYILGKVEESISVAKSIVGKRKDVMVLWTLWQLTEDVVYKDQIVEQYDIKMLNFLNKTHLP